MDDPGAARALRGELVDVVEQIQQPCARGQYAQRMRDFGKAAIQTESRTLSSAYA